LSKNGGSQVWFVIKRNDHRDTYVSTEEDVYDAQAWLEVWREENVHVIQQVQLHYIK
jgi:hypothetical protein